jgi:hypothetical protein
MALHPDFPDDPYAIREPAIRWFPADEPLDDKYRFLLFDDKRQVELVWNGKTSEVSNLMLPFQVIERVDENVGQTFLSA